MSVSQRYGMDELADFAKNAIRLCGESAIKLYGKGKSYIKFDDDLVTTAELNLQDLFFSLLKQKFPKHGLYRNDYDTTDYSHGEDRYLWVLDPLDGVANFQAGIPIWGISLALLENFWPVLGAFFMPATGDLFYAAAGQKAKINGHEISTSPQTELDDESLFFTYSRFHHYYHTSFPGKIRNLGCTGAHLCYVAMGRAEVAVISHVTYQDLAATRIIVEAAGARMFKVDGSEFFPNEYLDGRQIDEQLLVTSQQLLPQVIGVLNPVAP